MEERSLHPGLRCDACGAGTVSGQLTDDLLQQLRSQDGLHDLGRVALPRLVRCAAGRSEDATDLALVALLRELAELGAAIQETRR